MYVTKPRLFFDYALRNHFALPSFNVCNLEIARGVISAAEAENTPVNNMNTKLFTTVITVLAVFQAALLGLEIGIGLWLWVIIGVATLAFLCTLYFAMLLNRE